MLSIRKQNEQEAANVARISKAPEERRREFLDAAKHIFSHKGYEKTSVSDIVTEVGVAQGLFYYYFKSKQECFECIVEEEVAFFLEKVRAEVEKIEPAVERVRTIFVMMLEYLERLDSIDVPVSPRTRERFGELEERICAQVMKESTETLADVIKYGNGRGEFHCTYPLPTARMIAMGLLNGMAAVKEKPRAVLAEYEPVLQDLCGRLLGVERF